MKETKDISANALISILGAGKAEAKTQAECCELLDCTPSELKAGIRRFRKENTDKDKFIVADLDGYYFAKDDQEKKSFIRMMSAQAIARFETVRQCKRSMDDQAAGQQTIEELMQEGAII